MKKLGEVFNDYESGGTIRCAEIEKVTLRKKSKALDRALDIEVPDEFYENLKNILQ